ncbi:DUF4347 domain-containing protein, partial [Synechococcus sp. Nb3U1]|uniref:DUF4347 domain-containing protein n=1 Tax=Synechococcus sp. Nb3U1 TaxID=1914529 RepID=UPI001F1CBEC7
MSAQKSNGSQAIQAKGLTVKRWIPKLGLGSVATALLLLISASAEINAVQKDPGGIVDTAARQELVFVDPNLPDLAILLAGIHPSAEVILLDSNQDGIRQITEVLSIRRGIQAIHILSHGSPGAIELGRVSLSLSNVGTYVPQLQAWQKALAPAADILIYGCHVAAGSEGELLVEQLAHLTQADIAASNNATGYADLNGDWLLEVTAGREVASTIVVENSAQQRYQHTLQTAAVPTLDVNSELTNVSVGTLQATPSSVINQVKLNRVDNANVKGSRQIVWVRDPDTPITLGLNTMEDALLIQPTLIIKAGSDNLFTNTGSVNSNNIERVDYINTSGITAPPAKLDKIGFLILERGGNDPFTISAIQSNPLLSPTYSSVISVGSGTWGKGTVIPSTKVYKSAGPTLSGATVTATVTNQKLSGVFVSYKDLGIAANQVFFGFSLAGEDAPTVPAQFADVSTFPTNTAEAKGGIDLAANGAVITFNPIADDDSAVTSGVTPVVIDVLANDQGVTFDLDPTSVTITTPASNGTVSVNPLTGEITYTPNPSFTGTDTFVYQVCDTGFLTIQPTCDTATVTVTVESVGPTANDDTATTPANTAVTIPVLGNDIAGTNPLDPTSVTITTPPSNGTVSVNPLTGEITYTPNPSFTGTDTFVYEVCDNGSTPLCDTATVTVTVESVGPTANDDTATTPANTAVTIPVLGNDIAGTNP